MPQKPLGQQEHGATDPRGFQEDKTAMTLDSGR